MSHPGVTDPVSVPSSGPDLRSLLQLPCRHPEPGGDQQQAPPQHCSGSATAARLTGTQPAGPGGGPASRGGAGEGGAAATAVLQGGEGVPTEQNSQPVLYPGGDPRVGADGPGGGLASLQDGGLERWTDPEELIWEKFLASFLGKKNVRVPMLDSGKKTFYHQNRDCW